MIFDSDNPITDIIGVEHMAWNGGLFDIKARNYSALAFRICGAAKITANGTALSVGENSILYLPQNLSYRAEYTDTEIIAIHFKALRNDLSPRSCSSCVSDVYKLFLRALAAWEGRRPGYTLEVMSALYGILALSYKSTAESELPEHFVKAVSLINSEYRSRELTVSGICKCCGMSETAFRALFKKYYRKTPVEYITELRLEKARMLIADGYSVKAAALESGFGDPKYFARVVKRTIGCTAKELKSFGK